MTPVIEVEHLNKRYGSFTAVHDISFLVEEGEIFGILGSNGSGKTTTVECVQGLRPYDGGRCRVFGYDSWRQRDELRPIVGSQLQQSGLPDRLKVWEAFDLFSSLSPGGRPWRHVIDEWGLGTKAGASFASLSGGQRQRLFVALAVLSDPKAVFLDELTQGLDPVARRETWSLIREVRSRGSTVVLVTHYMDEAEALCDRLAVVHKGRVLAVGTPRELMRQSGAATRVFFSSIDDDIDWLRGVPHVDEVQRDGPEVQIDGTGPVLAQVAAALVNRGIIPDDLRVEAPTLEDAFFQLTGTTERES